MIAHSRGRTFRSLDLPFTMTRKMEHIFLAQDHLQLEPALRKAELLALGMPLELMNAILSSRLATDLGHGEFWRTVWMFMRAHAGDISATQVGPIIDYIQAVRHDDIHIETQDGVVRVAPP